MNSIAFIDNFINDPANHCVNDFSDTFSCPVTYHQPARFGFSSLDALESDPMGVVILGSASHVTENLDWHKQLDIYLKRWQNNNVPVLGICFGHQFIVHSFGGSVGHHSNPPVNIKAIRKVVFTENLWCYKAGEEILLPYAHEQIVKSLPIGFSTIAGTLEHPFEIIRHDFLPIFGVQAHPEASKKFIDEIRLETDQSSDALKAGGRLFLGEFLSFCQSWREKL